MFPVERLKKLNTRENLWLYVLALLKKEPLYGWQFQLLIEKKFGFKPGRITPYRVLYRLEKDGFVKSGQKERRRVYQITEKGKEEFKKARKFYQDMLKIL